MSEQNIEVARRAADAFNRRDMASFVECFDENVVWVPLRDVPDLTEPAFGHAGMLAMLDRWLEPWDHYESATDEIVASGDAVLWTTRVHAEHDERGLRMNEEIYGVCDFRHGKIVLARWFWDKAEATEALIARDVDQQLTALRGTETHPAIRTPNAET